MAANADVLPKKYLIIDRFEIKKKLGQGGFGITYQAEDKLLHRPVALKELYL